MVSLGIPAAKRCLFVGAFILCAALASFSAAPASAQTITTSSHTAQQGKPVQSPQWCVQGCCYNNHSSGGGTTACCGNSSYGGCCSNSSPWSCCYSGNGWNNCGYGCGYGNGCCGYGYGYGNYWGGCCGDASNCCAASWSKKSGSNEDHWNGGGCGCDYSWGRWQPQWNSGCCDSSRVKSKGYGQSHNCDDLSQRRP
jgi:hypothetical protein